VKTFKHPLIHAPNALQLLGDGKMYVTNDHYIVARVSPLLSKIETFSGAPGGTVVYTDLRNPQDTKIVARVPFANGVARLNSSMLAVASSSKPGVYLYSISADHTLTYRKMIRTTAGADNLSVDSEGKLLIAGHPYVPTLTKISQGRAECNEHGTEEEKANCACTAPSWAAEWSEEGGLRELLRDGAEGAKGICSSSTIVRDVGRGVGMISMLYGQGIVVFKE
jgi:arylesterase/paraoxonase